MIEFCWYVDGRGVSLDQEIAKEWGEDVVRAHRKLKSLETSPQPVYVTLKNLIPHLQGPIAKEYDLRKIKVPCRGRKERRIISVHIPKDSPNRILILHHFIEKKTGPDYQKAIKIAANRLNKIHNNEATYEQKSINKTLINKERKRIEKNQFL